MYPLALLVVLGLPNAARSYGSTDPSSISVQQIIERDRKNIFMKFRDKYILQDHRIEKTLLKYDRAHFLPFHKTMNVYKDKYIYLGCGAEFSSPFVQAEALHLLRNHLKPGANVLELGSGTGYLATCMAELVQTNGSVTGLDLISPLVDFSVKATIAHAPHLVENNILKFFVADGRYGYKEFAPYDVIYTDCSIRSIPSVLIDQLKPGGRMIMTLGRTDLPQHLIVVDKERDGRPTFARVRLRNKVPRLCTNIREQDLYYQRMYPLRHKVHVPTLMDGVFMDPVGPNKYYTVPETFMGKSLNSDEMEHFAQAEKKYQEKIEQMGMHYGDGPFAERDVTFRTTRRVENFEYELPAQENVRKVEESMRNDGWNMRHADTTTVNYEDYMNAFTTEVTTVDYNYMEHVMEEPER